MGLFIEDGTGNGNIAKVDSRNRIVTHAICKNEMMAHAEEGDAYIIATPRLTVTTSEGAILWIKNNDNRNLYIDRVLIMANGGNTNYNRPMEFGLSYGRAVPTANMTAIVAKNMNEASAKTADVDSYCWDEVGTGMTIGSADSSLLGFTSPYFYELDLAGTMMLGQSNTITASLKGIEEIEASVMITFFFEDKI